MKNKNLKTILFIILLVIALVLSACSSPSASYKKYSYEFFGTFDTVIQITGYAQSQKEFDEYSSYAFSRFTQLHKLYDNYKTYADINNIKIINDTSQGAPIKVDSEIIELLDFCISSYENISSKTDITTGAMLNVWHNYRESGLNDPENAQVPTLDELESANMFTGIKNITLDKENSTVTLKEGTRLDLGAVAKGYATELVADELYDMGFESFFILSGGNVKTADKPLDDEKNSWSIGVQDPFNLTELSDIAYVNNMSVVTSGDYQRFYEVDGEIYHHLIDPETLFPATHVRSVTIFTEDSGLADFLSTTMFLMPFDEGLSLIESLENTEAYWIFPDGTIEATDGAKSFLRSYITQ